MHMTFISIGIIRFLTKWNTNHFVQNRL